MRKKLCFSILIVGLFALLVSCARGDEKAGERLESALWEQFPKAESLRIREPIERLSDESGIGIGKYSVSITLLERYYPFEEAEANIIKITNHINEVFQGHQQGVFSLVVFIVGGEDATICSIPRIMWMTDITDSNSPFGAVGSLSINFGGDEGRATYHGLSIENIQDRVGTYRRD